MECFDAAFYAQNTAQSECLSFLAYDCFVWVANPRHKVFLGGGLGIFTGNLFAIFFHSFASEKHCLESDFTFSFDCLFDSSSFMGLSFVFSYFSILFNSTKKERASFTKARHDKIFGCFYCGDDFFYNRAMGGLISPCALFYSANF